MKTPVNGKTIREHLHYSVWKYLVVLVAVVFGWNIVFAVTAPRPLETEKVTLYTYIPGNDNAFNHYIDRVHALQMSDMKEMALYNKMADESTVAQVIFLFLTTGESDINLLGREYFQSYAASGAFIPLDLEPGFMDLCDALELDLRRGWRTNTDTGEKHLYGIPVSALPGLSEVIADPTDAYLCPSINSGNNENVVKFLKILIQDAAKNDTITDLYPEENEGGKTA